MQHRHPTYKFEESLDKDLEAIAAIATSVFPEAFSREDIEKELMNKKHRIYLAKDRGRIVGFNIWYEDKEDGQVWDWLHAVHPDYRKSGIGSKLMNRVIERTRELGYSRIRLKVYENFHSMIRFCRRKGFVKIKVEKSDTWGDSKYSIYFQYNLINNLKSPMPIPEPKPEVPVYLDVLQVNDSYIIGLSASYVKN